MDTTFDFFIENFESMMENWAINCVEKMKNTQKEDEDQMNLMFIFFIDGDLKSTECVMFKTCQHRRQFNYPNPLQEYSPWYLSID